MKGAILTQGGPKLVGHCNLPAKPLISSRRTTQRISGRVSSKGEKADLSGENMFKDTAAPGTELKDVMSTSLTVATPETSVENAKKLLTKVTGVPVVKSSSDWTLLGVLSKKDVQIKSGSTVSEIMSKPPIAARPDNKVADAACLMLKHKVHRIPVVDNSAKLVGIVTRTDIFTALENEQGSVDVKVKL